MDRAGQPLLIFAFITPLVRRIDYSYPNQDDMVRDGIVIGVLDKTTQERHLREPELSLQKALNFCKAVKPSKTQSNALQKSLN